eukprot:COSAG01_NODE_2425_length_7679_cov_96.031221_4_plen_144_part_00
MCCTRTDKPQGSDVHRRRCAHWPCQVTSTRGCHPPRRSLQPVKTFPSSNLRDKNRRDVGKFESKCTTYTMQTPGLPLGGRWLGWGGRLQDLLFSVRGDVVIRVSRERPPQNYSARITRHRDPPHPTRLPILLRVYDDQNRGSG